MIRHSSAKIFGTQIGEALWADFCRSTAGKQKLKKLFQIDRMVGRQVFRIYQTIAGIIDPNTVVTIREPPIDPRG
jgi:hypothetical protein